MFTSFPFLPFVSRPSHSNFAVQKVRSPFPPPYATPPQLHLTVPRKAFTLVTVYFLTSPVYSVEGRKVPNLLKNPLDQPFILAWGRGGCGREDEEEEEEGDSLAVPWANRAKWFL